MVYINILLLLLFLGMCNLFKFYYESLYSKCETKFSSLKESHRKAIFTRLKKMIVREF